MIHCTCPETREDSVILFCNCGSVERLEKSEIEIAMTDEGECLGNYWHLDKEELFDMPYTICLE